MSTRRSRAWIFLPTLIGALIIAAYSAYWFFARGFVSDLVDTWIADQRAAGAVVEYDSKSITGFPFRLTLNVENPVLSDPRTGAGWRGSDLQMTMQPWNYYHIIARSPGRNMLDLGPAMDDDALLLLGPKSATSLSWNDETITRASLALDEAAFTLGDDEFAADDFHFHLRPAPTDGDILQLELNWQRLDLGALPLGDAAVFGQEVGPSILRAELVGGVDALSQSSDPVNAISLALANGGELLVPQLMIEWGPASLGARAELRRTNGELRGTLGVRIDRAEELRDALRASGQLTDEIDAAITMLDAASAENGFLPLSIRGDGLYALGNQIAPLALEDIL